MEHQNAIKQTPRCDSLQDLWTLGGCWDACFRLCLIISKVLISSIKAIKVYSMTPFYLGQTERKKKKTGHNPELILSQRCQRWPSSSCFWFQSLCQKKKKTGIQGRMCHRNTHGEEITTSDVEALHLFFWRQHSDHCQHTRDSPVFLLWCHDTPKKLPAAALIHLDLDQFNPCSYRDHEQLQNYSLAAASPPAPAQSLLLWTTHYIYSCIFSRYVSWPCRQNHRTKRL